MAASLAVSLAAVTCRDALNSGLMTHLQHALETVVTSNCVNEIAALLCRTNHPVGCEYVERMALDRAMKDIEDHMAPVRTVSACTHPLLLPPALPWFWGILPRCPSNLQQRY